MSHELQPDEPVAAGLRRALRAHAADASAALEGQADVHAARKALKRVRALLPLASAAGLAADEPAQWARAAMKAVATGRDAEVMWQTFGRLLDTWGDALRPESMAVLEDELATGATTDPTTGVRVALAAITELDRDLEAWLPRRGRRAAVDTAAARARRKAVRRIPATADHDAEAMHRLRGAVKAYWHVAAWLGDAEDSLDDLQERLGDDHDLHVLSRWAAAHDAPAGRLVALLADDRRRAGWPEIDRLVASLA